jgi:hypothetical protein
MTHTIVSVTAHTAREAGALDGFTATCSCGYLIGRSIERMAVSEGWAHARYMNAKASK